MIAVPVMDNADGETLKNIFSRASAKMIYNGIHV